MSICVVLKLVIRSQKEVNSRGNIELLSTAAATRDCNFISVVLGANWCPVFSSDILSSKVLTCFEASHAKILSADFTGPSEIRSGSVFRINNRIGNRFFSSADFICAGFTFLDFDLKNYLMPHDLNSPFVRRKDEYADPSLAPDYLNKLPEKNAY